MSLLLLLNVNNGLGGSTPVPVLDAAAREFAREATTIVSLTVAGDVAGSQTFYFSPKDGAPLSARYGLDIRPYLLSFQGRPTKIEPDRAVTQRARLTFAMAEDPNAPPFDSAVFSVYQGGSFWRRLVVAQPDYIGSVVEVKQGYIFSGVAFIDFRRIFKGRLEDIDFQTDGSVALIAKDDLALADRQVPAETSDDNLLNGLINATATAITVDDGSEFSDPADLDSKDLFPPLVRIEPGTGNEEDVILTSKAGNVLTVQDNYVDKSEAFDNAAWTKSATTVAANNEVGPFGGDPAADLLTFAAVGSYVEQDTSEAASATDFTFSVWLKRGPSTTADGTVTLDLSLSDGSEQELLCVQVTADWQRFEVSKSFTGGAGQTAVVRIRRNAGDLAEVLAFGTQAEKDTTRGFYAATDGNAGADAGRGAFGSTAVGHADDSEIQEAIVYRLHLANSGVHPIVVLRDLVNRGQIAAADVDQSSFDNEFDFIQSTQVRRSGTASIGKPRKLLEHVKELSQQVLLDLWVGEDGLVKTRYSFRQNQPGANVKTISDEDNVIEKGSSYKGNADGRVTRVFVYYTLVAGEEGNKPEDFSNWKVNADLGVEGFSGQKAKAIFSKWIFRSAEAVALASRLISRYRRGARVSTWDLDMKDEPDFFVGDVIQLDSPDFLKPSGSSAVRAETSWQVVQKAYQRRRGRVRVAGLQFSGLRYAIISPANGIENPGSVFPDYPAASGRERQYGFIGDANNLVDSSTEQGYFIL